MTYVSEALKEQNLCRRCYLDQGKQVLHDESKTPHNAMLHLYKGQNLKLLRKLMKHASLFLLTQIQKKNSFVYRTSEVIGQQISIISIKNYFSDSVLIQII